MLSFLLDNVLLLTVIVLTIVALLLPAFMQRRYGPQITPQEATKLINKEHAQVIDVRKPAEYKKGHIARAVNMPVDTIQNRLGDLSRERPVLLVDRTGGDARTAARLLRGVGLRARKRHVRLGERKHAARSLNFDETVPI